MIEARLADGRILQFPDGTDPQVIQATVKRMLGDRMPEAIAPESRPREDILRELTLAQSQADMPRVEQLLGELEGRGAAGAEIIEPLATMVTGAVAEPVAGVAGIAQAVNPFAEPGAGARAVEATREALTFQPTTEAGQEGLEAVGEVLQPVGEAIQSVEKDLGDSVFKATGSPALAAAATTIPTAIMEAIGLGVGGRLARRAKSIQPSKAQVRSMLNEAAPDVDTLKSVSRQVYEELDQSGITVKPEAYKNLVKNVKAAAKKQGLSKRTTKKSFGAIKDLEDVVGQSPTLSDVDDLRKVAQGVASDIDLTEKAIGGRIVSEIDDFLDSVKPENLVAPEGVAISDIGSKYRAARNLWGRARKSELISEAIENAKGRASGFENGIRIELGKLAKNKRTKKFLTKEEIAAIKDIERGNVQQNFSKFLGRFAFNEGRANNVLSALGGVGGGALVGGPVGAVAVPVTGQIARGIASKITLNRAKFLDDIVRAGKNGEEITKAYLSSIPKGKRSASDLSRLLSDPNVDLDALFKSSNETVKKAAEIAAGNQLIGASIGVLAPTVVKSTQGEEDAENN